MGPLEVGLWALYVTCLTPACDMVGVKVMMRIPHVAKWCCYCIVMNENDI